jgi:hypothetical protein
METHFNMLSFIIAGLTPTVVGFLYYHPKLMGSSWMKANGFTPESMGQAPKPIYYIVSLVASFLFAFFLWGWTTGAGGADHFQVADVSGKSHVTFAHGAFHGTALSLLVFLPLFVTMAIFEKRTWSWAFINLGYWAICSILMCGVLSAWR